MSGQYRDRRHAEVEKTRDPDGTYNINRVPLNLYPCDGESWGPWTFHANNFTLELKTKKDWYEVDLEECGSSSGILDWIMQVAGKSWVDAGVLANLVFALDDLLDPQAHVCSGGMGRKGKWDVAKYIANRTTEAKKP